MQNDYEVMIVDGVVVLYITLISRSFTLSILPIHLGSFSGIGAIGNLDMVKSTCIIQQQSISQLNAIHMHNSKGRPVQT